MFRGHLRAAMCVVLFWGLGVGCGAAPIPRLNATESRVEVKKVDPPAGYKVVGTVKARHGNGCPAFGKKGSYQGALVMLKRRAAAMGAHYVRLDMVDQPQTIGIDGKACTSQTYVVEGMAYQNTRLLQSLQESERTGDSGH